jgi:hypothetical protein
MGRWHARCVLNGRGGRYHFTARGNELGIFRDEAEHFLFLGLLSQLGEYFGVRVHAYVLMGNHYR